MGETYTNHPKIELRRLVNNNIFEKSRIKTIKNKKAMIMASQLTDVEIGGGGEGGGGGVKSAVVQ